MTSTGVCVVLSKDLITFVLSYGYVSILHCPFVCDTIELEDLGQLAALLFLRGLEALD